LLDLVAAYLTERAVERFCDIAIVVIVLQSLIELWA
jgi:hypothetical protein